MPSTKTRSEPSDFPLDPGIGPLQNNGGPTFTHALLTGSPAIDKGRSPGVTTDQRGRSRTYDFSAITNAIGGDNTDIGAFEVNPPLLNLARSANNLVLSWLTNDSGYTLQTKINLNPAVGWVTVFPAPLIINGENTVTNPISGTQQFFRIIKSSNESTNENAERAHP